MKICKECKHFKSDSYSLFCVAPQNMTEISLVTGKRKIKITSPFIQRDTRLDGYCGPDGLWWEKKIVRWWEFWKL